MARRSTHFDSLRTIGHISVEVEYASYQYTVLASKSPFSPFLYIGKPIRDIFVI